MCILFKAEARVSAHSNMSLGAVFPVSLTKEPIRGRGSCCKEIASPNERGAIRCVLASISQGVSYKMESAANVEI